MDVQTSVFQQIKSLRQDLSGALPPQYKYPGCFQFLGQARVLIRRGWNTECHVLMHILQEACNSLPAFWLAVHNGLPYGNLMAPGPVPQFNAPQQNWSSHKYDLHSLSPFRKAYFLPHL